ncbi:hypothetical protein I3843_16G096000 [Carya illinoinensis]|uniref:uncharacterized protein LOC122298540 n=1 Tax=Carya illinoinensis TaxID=32201 RepID=UPI001BFB427C|nr:uncharacterized protein LOC122298540 [Carya illinoinensis]KAG2664751.1 hypothetical protein I3760_16G098300 [Carya illinoinensis]KAG7942309.1 hypothetical protein I3843_16G096000 [Carya illinoinensis]
MENAKNNNSSSHNKTSEKRVGIEQKGFPVHSQVRKIKQESEKIIDWSPEQPEMRLVLREIQRRLSRSPLGLSC